MEFLLTLLGLTAGAVFLGFLGLLLLAYLGSTLAGRIVEGIFDFLVPPRRTQVGAEGLVGRSATVVTSFVTSKNGGSEGTVRISAELWNARCEAGGEIGAGARVRILAVDELLVLVEED